MSDISERLGHALASLESVADSVTADEAARDLDEATLQMFWRDWPRVSSWAGALWRRMNEDLEDAARPPRDPELDEVGEAG